MRIILKTAEAVEHILCDGAVPAVDKHVGPTDLRTSGPIQTQAAQFLRATDGKAHNRGNKLVRVSFSVTRECAGASAAEKFCWTYQRDVARAGTLSIRAEGSTGSLDKLSLADAIVDDVQCQQIGCVVIVTYTITGGALT